MTASEMILQIWENLGEPSDLPVLGGGGAVDMALPGSQRILQWLNRAQNHTAFFKFGEGRQIRFRQLYSKLSFQTVVIPCNVQASSTSGVVLEIPAAYRTRVAVEDFYDWGVGTSGSLKRIRAATYDGLVSRLTITPDSPYTAAPTVGTTINLYKRRYLFNGVGFNATAPNGVYEVMKVFDDSNGTQMEESLRVDSLYDGRDSVGDPTEYTKISIGLEFNTYPSSERWITVEHYKFPTLMTLATSEPDVPRPFHECVLTWAQAQGYARSQEIDDRRAEEKRFTEMMALIRNEFDLGSEVAESYMVRRDL